MLLLLSIFALSIGTNILAADTQSLDKNHEKYKDKKNYSKVQVYNRSTHKIQKIKFNLKAHALKGHISDLTIDFDGKFSPSQDEAKEIYLSNEGYIGGIKISFAMASDQNYDKMYIEFAKRSKNLSGVKVFVYDDYTEVTSKFEK
ncbi:hypothetical protein KJ644_03780 [Candidatus Dependentiae bacterium]|nr:hypothetical protein [Candidatus Dependentiae bacterium]